MFYPGWFIALATFPGTVVHEMAHRFFCDILQVEVYDVCYFDPMNDDVAGYVSHQGGIPIWHSFLIGIAPLIINTFLCMILTFPLMSSWMLFFTSGIQWEINAFSSYNMVINVLYIIMGWIGISVGACAFPSNQDLNNVTELVYQTQEHPDKYLIISFVATIFTVLNFLRMVWLSFIYAIAVGMILPYFCFCR